MTPYGSSLSMVSQTCREVGPDSFWRDQTGFSLGSFFSSRSKRNNQTEYEALIAGMLLAKDLRTHCLLAMSDSMLITRQVSGEYQAKDPHLASYLRYVKMLKEVFSTFNLIHVPREQNSHMDLLSKLLSLGKGGRHRFVIQETLKVPRVSVRREQLRGNVGRLCT